MQHQVNEKITYLDYAAATPLSEVARKAMEESYNTVYGNPSSVHPVGRRSYDALWNSRKQLASALSVDPKEIILTGSGTEADNLAVLGLARAHRAHGRHIIVSAIEHKAVLMAARQLEQEGFLVTYLPVDKDGTVPPLELQAALRPATILVSIMYANNEIGTIEPIKEVVEVCRAYQSESQYPLVHTDACQAVGMLPVAPRALGVDAMTINSSKIYGPKGIGLLYLRGGVKVEPFVVGGAQEGGVRAGTESTALAAGFAAAVSEAVANRETYAARLRGLQEHFISELQKNVPQCTFNGHPTNRLPNNVHITIPDVEGESLVLLLGEAGICAATGSACSSEELAPSHVLTAIGQDEEVIHGSLRFTLGRDTTKDELTRTARTLAEVVSWLRSVTASTTTVYQNMKNTV